VITNMVPLNGQNKRDIFFRERHDCKWKKDVGLAFLQYAASWGKTSGDLKDLSASYTYT
jgi:hypothetical protein